MYYAVKGYDMFPEESNIWEIRYLEDGRLHIEFSVPMTLNDPEIILQMYLDSLEFSR